MPSRLKQPSRAGIRELFSPIPSFVTRATHVFGQGGRFATATSGLSADALFYPNGVAWTTVLMSTRRFIYNRVLEYDIPIANVVPSVTGLNPLRWPPVARRLL